MSTYWQTITGTLPHLDHSNDTGVLTVELFQTVILGDGTTVYPQRFTFTVTSGAVNITLPATDTVPMLVTYAPNTNGANANASTATKELGYITPLSTLASDTLNALLARASTTATIQPSQYLVGPNNFTIVQTTAMLPVTTATDQTRALVKGVGFFRYDAASVATTDGATVFAGLSGVGRWVLEVGGQNQALGLNAVLYGVDATGTGDSTAALNALFSAAPAGSEIVFPAGAYKITGQLAWSGKRLHLQGHGKARIVEGTAITGADAAGAMLLIGAGSDQSTVSGIQFDGIETLTSFNADPGGADKEYCAVRVASSDTVLIENCAVTGKRIGVILDTTTNARVAGLKYFGILTAPASGGATGTDNYSNGIKVKGTTKTIITDLIAKNAGSAILTGVNDSSIDPDRLVVHGVHAENMWDNLGYFSSVQNALISGFTGLNTNGTGIKIRGSNNVITGCYISGASVGFALSGSGSSPDSYGATGHYATIQGCVADTITHDGVSLDTVNGYNHRNFKIVDCSFSNFATAGGTYAGIRGESAAGGEVRGCSFINPGGQYVVLITGTSGAHAKDLLVCDNTIFGGAGVADAIRLQYVDSSTIAGNIIRDCSTGIGVHLLNSVGCLVRDNVSDNTLTLVSSTSGDSVTQAVILDNLGAITADHTTNLVVAVSKDALALGANAVGSTAQITLNPRSGKGAAAAVSASGATGYLFHGDGSYGFLDYDLTSTNGVRLAALSKLRFGLNTNATYGSSTFNEAFNIQACGTGYLGMGSNGITPTAQMHMYPQGAAAGSAPLKFSASGNLMTTAEQGAFEFLTDTPSNSLWFTPASNRERLFTGPSRVAATINPGAIAAGTTWESAEIAVTNAAATDPVLIGPPAAIEAGLVWSAFVSSAGHIKLRIANVSAGGVTPASASWQFTVLH